MRKPTPTPPEYWHRWSVGRPTRSDWGPQQSPELATTRGPVVSYILSPPAPPPTASPRRGKFKKGLFDLIPPLPSGTCFPSGCRKIL
eukprot:5426448-Pyramimonas_sp.AAC.1